MAQQPPSPGSFLSPEWSHRMKGAQFGFIAGIVIGLIFGWIFHSVISLAFQFGLVLVLLVPLVIIGWLWFRAQRGPRMQGQEGQGPRAGMWTTVIDVQSMNPSRPQPPVTEPEPSPRDQQFIDVPLVRPAPEQRPSDVEAELEALKRAREDRS